MPILSRLQIGPPEADSSAMGSPQQPDSGDPRARRGDPDPDSPARRHGRVRVSGANASLGRILDISAGGMRVASRAMAHPPRQGTTIPVQIDVGDQEWMSVTCRVAWVRSTGMRRRELGLEFVQIDQEVKRALLAIAHTSGSAGGFRLLPESEREG